MKGLRKTLWFNILYTWAKNCSHHCMSAICSILILFVLFKIEINTQGNSIFVAFFTFSPQDSPLLQDFGQDIRCYQINLGKCFFGQFSRVFTPLITHGNFLDLKLIHKGNWHKIFARRIDQFWIIFLSIFSIFLFFDYFISSMCWT